MTITNKYEDSLKIEDSAKAVFNEVYTNNFNNIARIERVTDREKQKMGHDVYLHGTSGDKLIIDEKVRTSNWNDILVEYLSSKETGSAGWIEHAECDYYAYLFPSKGCYFIDTKKLKEWYFNNRSEFMSYKDVESVNYHSGLGIHYTTVSKAIPIDVLRSLGIISFVFSANFVPPIKQASPVL